VQGGHGGEDATATSLAKTPGTPCCYHKGGAANQTGDSGRVEGSEYEERETRHKEGARFLRLCFEFLDLAPKD
jgi:hypothetical protein